MSDRIQDILSQVLALHATDTEFSHVICGKYTVKIVVPAQVAFADRPLFLGELESALHQFIEKTIEPARAEHIAEVSKRNQRRSELTEKVHIDPALADMCDTLIEIGKLAGMSDEEARIAVEESYAAAEASIERVRERCAGVEAVPEGRVGRDDAIPTEEPAPYAAAPGEDTCTDATGKRYPTAIGFRRAVNAVHNEIVYQDKLPHRTAESEAKDVQGFLTLIDVYLTRAKADWADQAGDQAAVHGLRKIAAIALRGMTYCGILQRDRGEG